MSSPADRAPRTTFWSWYRWIWRESFAGESVFDRFAMRCLVLAFHTFVLIVLIIAYGIAHGR